MSLERQTAENYYENLKGPEGIIREIKTPAGGQGFYFQGEFLCSRKRGSPVPGSEFESGKGPV